MAGMGTGWGAGVGGPGGPRQRQRGSGEDTGSNGSLMRDGQLYLITNQRSFELSGEQNASSSVLHVAASINPACVAAH